MNYRVNITYFKITIFFVKLFFKYKNVSLNILILKFNLIGKILFTIIYKYFIMFF